MDYLFLTILGLYGVKGFLKGFVRMLLSLFSVVIVAILAYMIVLKLSNGQILFGIYDYFNSIFKDIFNNLIPGQFSNIDDLIVAIGSSNVIITPIIKLVLKGVYMDGNMTAGEILAPNLAMLVYKIILFVIVFLLLSVIVKLLNLVVNLIIKKTGLSLANRTVGLILGLLKGIIISSILYLILSTLASLNISEELTNFMNMGAISNYIYQNFVVNIFEFVYSL